MLASPGRSYYDGVSSARLAGTGRPRISVRPCHGFRIYLLGMSYDGTSAGSAARQQPSLVRIRLRRRARGTGRSTRYGPPDDERVNLQPTAVCLIQRVWPFRGDCPRHEKRQTTGYNPPLPVLSEVSR